MNRFLIFLALLFSIIQPELADAQIDVREVVAEANSQQAITISGTVTDLKKYSFKISTDDNREYQVRLAPQAPIVLQMNKPWFDWEKDRIVVSSNSPTDLENEKPERIAYPVSTDRLYVVSQFKNARHMKRMVAKTPLRLSHYLLTLTKQHEHLPTESEHYISGKLTEMGANNSAQLKIGDQKISVLLGHREATIDGFTIQQLLPQTTHVTLTGTIDKNSEIVAQQILFYPISVP